MNMLCEYEGHSMKEIQQPKKQPEIIRKRIIEQTIILASEKGISGISLQSVANGVGVTKGGIYHHFANKDILIEEMIHEIIRHLNRKVEEIISNDDMEYGKFTRAYIHITFMEEIDGLVSPWSALSMTMITDKKFNSIFGKWLKSKLDFYQSTDDSAELGIIRLANEGLWLQSVTEIVDLTQTVKCKQDLIRRTYKNNCK